MTIHNEAMPGEIADVVIMPGDPKRASYIAEKYLFDYELVNDVRGMKAYTGYYHGKRVTIMASGMGIPSMGIYAYELFKFYNVKKLIRIGSAGALNENIKVRDIVLGTYAFSHSNFRYALTKNKSKKIASSNNLNQIILDKAAKLGTNVIKGTIYTSEVFDCYEPINHLLRDVPKNVNLLASEMEAFGIYTVANFLKKDATCLVSISDSKFEPQNNLTPEERQQTLDEMIVLALESIIR